MASTLIPGHTTWEMDRDDDGHRNYMIEHRVKADRLDGPAIILTTAGLPAIGSTWNFDNDVDAWAYCSPYAKVTPHHKEEPNLYWTVQQKFTTNAFKRCQDSSIEDPLLEPQKISGSFSKYTKEVQYDRSGNPIQYSSFEPVRGPTVEFDFNRPTVKVEQNVLNLELNIFSQMVDTVNDSFMWGLPTRCIKLSSVSWERKIYGKCNYYYTRSFEFDVDFNTFDRSYIDEGTKALKGHWIKQVLTGSTCQVDITSVGSSGAITGLTLSAGGSGYNTGTILLLDVVGGGGSGATFWAKVNSSGVVTDIRLSDPGTGYSPTLFAGTSVSPQKWVLDPIDGLIPDQTNMQHFIRFKDFNGENARVRLNGSGAPSFTAVFSNEIQYYPESNFFILGIPVSL